MPCSSPVMAMTSMCCRFLVSTTSRGPSCGPRSVPWSDWEWLGEEGAVALADAGASVDVDALTVAESVAADLIDELPDGSSALVLAFEHLWAVPLRDAVRDAGGLVLAHRTLSAEDLIGLGMLMGYAAELEAEQEAADSEA